MIASEGWVQNRHLRYTTPSPHPKIITTIIITINQSKNNKKKSLVRYNINHFTFNLITASTASFAKYSLSCDRILELKVVIAIFIKSDLNFSALLNYRHQCQKMHYEKRYQKLISKNQVLHILQFIFIEQLIPSLSLLSTTFCSKALRAHSAAIRKPNQSWKQHQ